MKREDKKMEAATETTQTQGTVRVFESKGEYTQSLTRLVETAVKNAMDQEMQKATQELLEEQKKAIRQIVDEYKGALRQVVEQEKRNIWAKAEELKQSIVKLGL